MLTADERSRLGGPGYFEYRFSSNSITADARAAELYGVVPNTAEGTWVGHPNDFVAAVLQEDRHLALSSGFQVRRDDRGTMHQSHPFRVAVDGTTHWARYTSYVFDECPDRAIGMVQDAGETTGLRERVQRLEQFGGRSEQLEMSSRMVAPIAHDLANLLTVLVPTVAVVRDEIDADEGLRAMLDAALAAGHSVSRLIAEILSLVRGADAPRMIPVRTEIEAAHRLLQRWLPKDFDVQLHVPDEPVYAWVPPGALTQAIVNLVLNSHDAMAATGGRIIVGVEMSDDEVQIYVDDDGPGIPEAIRDRLGEAFTTTKGERGTGFGLYMVRTTAERYGGRFSVGASSLGGARVMFSARRGAGAIGTNRSGAVPEIRGRQVMLFERDEEVRRLVAHVLTSAGAQVHECPVPDLITFLAPALPADVALVVGDTGSDDLRLGPLACLAIAREAGIRRIVWLGQEPVSVEFEGPVVPKPFDILPLLSAVAEVAADAGR